jgi:predicted phage terminase large subunit-like protein
MKLNADVVQGFVGSVLASRFDGQAASPPFHKECWELCTGQDRFVAIAAPRGHAKSTAITLGYGLATLLFRERKYMLVVSDTEEQAAMFLGMMKQELQDNEDLISLFDIWKNEKGVVEFEKDSSTDIIVRFKDGARFRVMAKGAEQKVRGRLWDGTRPDIIICDDMENDELVLNTERRKKMYNWFIGALLPSLSDQGIVRMVGTILHSDSLLEKVMPDPGNKFTMTTDLKQWSTKQKGIWKSVKYRAHDRDFNQLLWPSKKKPQFFKDLYAQAVLDGTTDAYSREYLNYPIDESVSFFRRQDFLPITEDDRKMKLNYYITVDLAISQEETADYSVFVIAGVDESKRIHLKNVIRERMDAREIVDTLIALQRLYDPVAVGIEDMQVSKSIGPFLREEMIKQNCYLTICQLKHGGKDKIFRARSMQARLRAHGVRFEKGEDWFMSFEQELMQFPRGKHDDQVDAFAYLGLMLDLLIEAPTQEEMDEDEYQEEYRQGGLADQGRNQWTGY